MTLVVPCFSWAMEKPSPNQIRYSFIEEGQNPFNPETNSFCIKAFHDNECIGSLTYWINPQARIGYIIDVHVQEKYRKNNICFNLINHMSQKIDKSCDSIQWDVISLDNVPLETLVQIYQKIVKKLGNGYELIIDYWNKNSAFAIPMKLVIKP